MNNIKCILGFHNWDYIGMGDTMGAIFTLHVCKRCGALKQKEVNYNPMNDLPRVDTVYTNYMKENGMSNYIHKGLNSSKIIYNEHICDYIDAEIHKYKKSQEENDVK